MCTRGCVAGKGCLTGTGAGWALDTRGLTRAPAYPQDSLVAEERFIELTVVSEAHVSHYRSHLGVGCLVVFDPYLHLDRTAHRAVTYRDRTAHLGLALCSPNSLCSRKLAKYKIQYL